MAKLFSPKEPVISAVLSFEALDSIRLPDIGIDIDEYRVDFGIATERLNTASGDFKLITSVANTIRSKEIASIDYFISIENYNPVISNIANNLGVRVRVPAMEDFKNQYGTAASHDIVMEGLYEFVARIWQKIKDLLSEFFKKIGMFFRRLVNAELDLETYEHYLSAMIVKIRSKDPIISDNKALIDSKLPSLLADEGVEEIDADYILGAGEEKLRRLLSITNSTFKEGLAELESDGLSSLHDLIKELISNTRQDSNNPDKLKEDIALLMVAAQTHLDSIFTINVRDTKSLPEKIYNALNYSFDRSEMENLTVRSLVDDENKLDRLPKNFNAYFIRADDKLNIQDTVELNTYVKNKLVPISTASNLVTFYEFYKKFSKGINIKGLDSIMDKAHKRIEAILVTMKNDYTDVLNDLAGIRRVKQLDESAVDPRSILNAIDKHVREEDKLSSSRALKAVKDLCEYTSMDKDLGDAIIHLLIQGKNKGPRYLMKDTGEEVEGEKAMTAFLEHTNFSAYAHHALEWLKTKKVHPDLAAKAETLVLLTEEEIDELRNQYDNLQKYLVTYVTSLQVALKELSTNLAGTYTELRIELVKYIYNSAKLYPM